MLPPVEEFTRYAPLIGALPADRPLTRPDLLTADFRLQSDGRVSIYYAPFGHINRQAKVVLLGISPGFRQMTIALRAAQQALLDGERDYAALLARVKYVASFGGPIRRYLIEMLDGVGLASALGIRSCALLYGACSALLHTSAVVRYPVFVNGADWNGHTPRAERHPLLRHYLWEGMLPELQALPTALVITLGKSASNALDLLIAAGAVDPARCAIGLPHPSGANGHRFVQYAASREAIADRVASWFGAHGTRGPVIERI